MGKVSKVDHNAQIAELADLGLDLGKTCDEVAEIDDVLDTISANVKKEAISLVSATKKNKTVINLVSFDAARDEAIMDASSLAKAYKKLKNEKKKAAAAVVSAVFDKYTGITRLSNANESGQIASLLQDFEAADVKAALASLDGMEEAIGDIKAKEEAFQAARRQSESAQAVSGESASAVKKRLVSYINEQLVPYLNVVSVVKSEKYEDLARKIDVTISKLNSTVVQRSAK